MNDQRNALPPSESLEVDRQDEASPQVETAARDASTPLAEGSDRATEPEAADIEQPPAAAVTEADSQQGEQQQGREEQQAAASRPATATDTPSQDPACPADESSSAGALESTATELSPTGPAAAKEAPASDPTTTPGAASTNDDTGGRSATSGGGTAAASASAAPEPGAAAQGKAAARPAIASKPAKQHLTFSALPKCLEGMPRIAAPSDYSHSRVRVRLILQDNLVLVKRLGEIARKPPAHEKGQAQLERFRVNVATSSAARRRTAAKEIMGQNMRIYRRLQEVKPSKAVARQQHDKDFAAHKRMLAALALGRRGASCVAA